MTEFIALTETTANTVTVYSERTQTWSTPVTSMDGYSTIFDPSGNLWTANANANSVTEFAPPYTGAPKTTITNGIDIPQSLAMDSNGNLFVTNVGGLPAYLQEYAPPYTSAPVLSIDDASVASMRNILIDNKNDLWITNDSATTALYELPAPVSTSHETNLGALGCQGITQDNAGNIVAACATTDHLYAYTTAGVAVNNAGIGESFPFLIPYPGGGTLDVIGSHSAGSVPIAFNDQTTSTFLHINCNCAVPSGIVIDANKLMYIADISNNVVVTLPYPYTGTAQLLQSGFGGAWAMAIWP
jgi:streptogramin lyase